MNCSAFWPVYVIVALFFFSLTALCSLVYLLCAPHHVSTSLEKFTFLGH